jgi:hypothetical protein
MSFAAEWATIKAKAVAEQEAKTKLAGLAPEYDKNGREIVVPGRGSGRELKVDKDLLYKRAAKVDDIRDSFRKADNSALAETRSAAVGLRGFKSQGGLKRFETRWEDQVKFLDGILNRGVAQGLRLAAADLSIADEKQGERLKKK